MKSKPSRREKCDFYFIFFSNVRLIKAWQVLVSLSWLPLFFPNLEMFRPVSPDTVWVLSSRTERIRLLVGVRGHPG